MKIKTSTLWRIPNALRFKQQNMWKQAIQVFAKQGGRWVKTADYNPALFFDTHCHTTNGGVNSYAYDTIWKGNFVVEAGDTFEFEIYATTPFATLDIDFGVERLRHLPVVDQYGKRIHAAELVLEQANRWHHRVFNLDPIVGYVGTSTACAIEDDQPGWRHLFARNAYIKNRFGQIKVDFLRDVGFFAPHEPWPGGGYANYSFQTKSLVSSANFD